MKIQIPTPIFNALAMVPAILVTIAAFKWIDHPVTKWAAGVSAITAVLGILARGNQGKQVPGSVVQHVLGWSALVWVLLAGATPQFYPAAFAALFGAFATLAALGRDNRKEREKQAALPVREEHDWPGTFIGTAIEDIKPGDPVSIVEKDGHRFIQRTRAEDMRP